VCQKVWACGRNVTVEIIMVDAVDEVEDEEAERVFRDMS
jgi:hypothetical protein